MKKTILPVLLFLAINLHSQEIKNPTDIQLNFGFMVHNNKLNVDTGMYDFNKEIESLVGFKNEIIIPTKKENFNLLVGYFFLHGQSNKTILQISTTPPQQANSKRIKNNGGIYTGLNLNKGNTIGFSSSIGMGICFYENTLIIDSDDLWGLSADEYSKTSSLAAGALVSFSPYIKIGRTKIFLSLESLINGNKKYMHLSYGGSLGLSITL